MKNTLLMTVLAAAMLCLVAPAYADDAEGEVNAVMVQIQTKDGMKWFKLGKDLKPMDLQPGDYVHFDYADDVIEEIEARKPAGKMKKE